MGAAAVAGHIAEGKRLPFAGVREGPGGRPAMPLSLKTLLVGSWATMPTTRPPLAKAAATFSDKVCPALGCGPGAPPPPAAPESSSSFDQGPAPGAPGGGGGDGGDSSGEVRELLGKAKLGHYAEALAAKGFLDMDTLLDPVSSVEHPSRPRESR